MTINRGLFTSEKCEWATPLALFDELNSEHGFELDAAANEKNRLCDLWHGPPKSDGLAEKWSPYRTWVNPPYGRQIALWTAKAFSEHAQGCPLIVMLLPARTDTFWFHNYIWVPASFDKAITVKFLRGRLKFGGAKNSAPFPSMLVTMRQL